MDEYEQAVKLAHAVLDRRSADPDDDLAVLARVLLRVLEDRARYPNKPDFVGRMIEAQFGNLRAAKESSDRYATQWHNESCKVYELLRECIPALELSHAMKRGGPAKSDALAILNRVRTVLAD
jgi:hypothetical protein